MLSNGGTCSYETRLFALCKWLICQTVHLFGALNPKSHLSFFAASIVFAGGHETNSERSPNEVSKPNIEGHVRISNRRAEATLVCTSYLEQTYQSV